MLQCDEIDLPSYARVTVNRLSEPNDPHLRIRSVLRVELPHSIRIDAEWDRDGCGYWITAWQAENGNVLELARRWAQDVDLAIATVESLSRSLS